VLLAGSVFTLDYRYGWDATKEFTFYACIVYFVLNGLLTGWIWLGENRLVFDGSRDGGERLRI
jgi:signal peptidase complex subunit 2